MELLGVKVWGLILECCLKLFGLSLGEGGGIFGAGIVKFVDIGKNISGEEGFWVVKFCCGGRNSSSNVLL